MHGLLRTLLASTLLVACTTTDDPSGESSSSTDASTGPVDPGEPRATFLAKVDMVELCGVEGAQVVTFLARQVGCEPGPPAPCTLKTDPYLEWTGAPATCPSALTSLDMSVDVPFRGRFQVEARTTTNSGFRSECFGADGTVPTVVTTEQVEAREQIFVVTTAKPCPAP